MIKQDFFQTVGVSFTVMLRHLDFNARKENLAGII